MNTSIKVLDGGMGTSLSDMGLDLSGSLWSARVLVDNPEAIKTVHQNHARAGADILTSSSYQASLRGFLQAGYSRDDYFRALEVSTVLARDVAEEIGREQGRKIFVAASIGPFGATLADGSEYRGNYGVSREFLIDFHAERLEHLSVHEFDYLAFETVPSAIELEAINQLLTEDFRSIRAWVSCSARSESEISDGTLFTDAMTLLTAKNIIARGVNCTPPHFIASLIESTDGPFVVYPNAGTWDALNRQWLEVDESSFHIDTLQAWLEKDVQILGGCCGLDSGYIKAVAQAVNR